MPKRFLNTMEQSITCAAGPGTHNATALLLNKVVSDFGADLQCPICLELLQDPTQLPCCHFFCWDCIHKTLKHSNAKVRCPICKKTTNRRDLTRSELLTQLCARYTALEAHLTNGLASEGMPAQLQRQQQAPLLLSGQPAQQPATCVSAPDLVADPPAVIAAPAEIVPGCNAGKGAQRGPAGHGKRKSSNQANTDAGEPSTRPVDEPLFKHRPQGALFGQGAAPPTVQPVDLHAVVTGTDACVDTKPSALAGGVPAGNLPAPLTLSTLFDAVPGPQSAVPSSGAGLQGGLTGATLAQPGTRLSSMFAPVPEQQQAGAVPTDAHVGAGGSAGLQGAKVSKARGTKRMSPSPAGADVQTVSPSLSPLVKGAGLPGTAATEDVTLQPKKSRTRMSAPCLTAPSSCSTKLADAVMSMATNVTRVEPMKAPTMTRQTRTTSTSRQQQAVPATPVAKPVAALRVEPPGEGFTGGRRLSDGPGSGTSLVLHDADREVVASAGLISSECYGMLKVTAAAASPGAPIPDTAARRVPVRLMPWACPNCTLHNNVVAKKCIACHKPRPRDAMLVAPEMHAPVPGPAVPATAVKSTPAIRSRACMANAMLPLQASDQQEQSNSAAAASETMHQGRKQPPTGAVCSDLPAPSAAVRKPAKKAAARTRGPAANSVAGKPGGDQPQLGQAAEEPGTDDVVAGTAMEEVKVGRTPIASPQEGVLAAPAADPQPSNTAAFVTPAPAATTSRSKARKTVPSERSAPSTATATASKPPLPTGLSRSAPVTPTANTAVPPAATAGGPKQGGRRGGGWPGAAHWVLLGSGLSPSDIVVLKKLASLSGCEIVDEWRVDVTHIICGEDGQGRAKRTVKYLLAVAHGCWVLRFAWIQSCLTANAPVPPDDYEIQADLGGGVQGPKNGRMAKATGRKLLDGYLIHLAGPFSAKEDMSALAKASGATVILRPPVRASSDTTPAQDHNQDMPTDRSYVLVDVESCKGVKKAVQVSASAVEAGMNLLSYKWLLDCVGSQHIARTAPHVVK